MVRVVAICALLLVPAAAAADGERALSAGVGLGWFSVPGTKVGNMEPPSLSPTIGGALAIAYERMIGTDVGLRAELVGTAFYGGEEAKQSPKSFAAVGDVGVVFRFDVLRWVPYAFGGLGGVATTGGPISRATDLVLVVGGGLDFLKTRTRSYGGEVRLASFGGDVTVVTIGVRGTTRWGLF